MRQTDNQEFVAIFQSQDNGGVILDELSVLQCSAKTLLRVRATGNDGRKANLMTQIKESEENCTDESIRRSAHGILSLGGGGKS